MWYLPTGGAGVEVVERVEGVMLSHVEEYPEQREHVPEHSDDLMPAPCHWLETDFDLDPTRGVNKHGRSDLAHGSEPRRCGVPGCDSPVTPLSDYGYYCWEFVDDEGDPEWVPLCWVHARPMFYNESNVVDPQTGRKATDGVDNHV